MITRTQQKKIEAAEGKVVQAMHRVASAQSELDAADKKHWLAQEEHRKAMKDHRALVEGLAYARGREAGVSEGKRLATKALPVKK